MMRMLRRRRLTENVMYSRVLMVMTHVMTHTSVSPVVPTRLSLANQA